MRHKQFHLSKLGIVWDDLGCLRILRVPVLFPPIAGYSPGEIHTRKCALVVRLLRRHSNLQTSSLGSCQFIESTSLARFCCEFLNLQHFAKSAFSALVPPNEAQTRHLVPGELWREKRDGDNENLTARRSQQQKRASFYFIPNSGSLRLALWEESELCWGTSHVLRRR